METRNLYNIYRPKTFSEVFGQESIINILKNSINSKKINHSYLFTGTRGVGKTSIARIFAMYLNCKNPSSDFESCGKCENCLSILNSSSLDVIEIDAASNNSVDEIRSLHEKSNYLLNSNYKIFIIDEVHMLSKAAFNAFLKLLEEPPQKVIFILITTEINKIPKTILSRTVILDFQPIDKNTILESINFIATKENIKIEKNALETIAFLSKGSLRDSISILEKLIMVSKNNQISNDDVLNLFNLTNISKIIEIIKKNDVDNFLEILKKSKNNIVQFLEFFLKIYSDLIVESQIKLNNIFNNFVNELIELFLINSEPEIIYSIVVYKIINLKSSTTNSLNINNQNIKINNDFIKEENDLTKINIKKSNYSELVNENFLFNLVLNLSDENYSENDHLYKTKHIFKSDKKFNKLVSILDNSYYEGIYKNIILISFLDENNYELFKKNAFDSKMFLLTKEIFANDFYLIGVTKSNLNKIKKFLDYKIEKKDETFFNKLKQENMNIFEEINQNENNNDLKKLAKIFKSKIKVK